MPVGLSKFHSENRRNRRRGSENVPESVERKQQPLLSQNDDEDELENEVHSSGHDDIFSGNNSEEEAFQQDLSYSDNEKENDVEIFRGGED